MSVAERAVGHGSDYSELLRHMKRAGLLNRKPRQAVLRIVLIGSLLAAGWTVFALLGESWWQVAVAGFLALVFTQLGFLGHDAGHRQLFRSNRANDVVGLVSGNLGIGLSFGWWMAKHNRHHAHPNHEEHDPDVRPGAIVFIRPNGRGRRGLAGAFARAQAFLFFPLLTLEAMSLHVASVRSLLRRDARRRPLETVLFGLHVSGYLAAVLIVLSPWQALVFVAVHQGLFGLYLGCSFAPNHKGMPSLSAVDELDFLRRQVLTARNVRGGPVVDFALGGLNYQIEHHLFPSMPRANLRHAQPVVRAFCADRGVPYRESTLIASYAEALRHLHAVGRPAAAAGRL
jgi:fatty acid desaturase